MDIFSTFAVDTKREDEGTWVTIGDAEIRLGRIGSTRYRSELARRLETRPEGSPERERAIVELFADCVLLGWRNLSYQGKPMEYTRENAIRLLDDPQLREFREWIVRQATDRENYRAKIEAENADKLGNS